MDARSGVSDCFGPFRYGVKLLRGGPERMELMRAIRSARPDLGLKETKAFVEAVPQIVKIGLTGDEAETLKRKLDRFGSAAIVNEDGTPL